MEPVEAMFREYETLRQEVLQSITHRTQIISFGFGGIATVASAALLATFKNQDPLVVTVIYVVLVPVASVLFLYLWLAELARMFRASDHLAGLEGRINEAVGKTPLTWERGLLERNKRYRFHLLVVALFSAMSLSSGFLALAISDLRFSDVWAWLPGVLISVGVALHVGDWTEDLRMGNERSRQPIRDRILRLLRRPREAPDTAGSGPP